MEIEKKQLRFSISGEFITRTAREWLFDCGKPYSVVEDLLLSCMEGTGKTDAELRIMAQEILLGRAEFQGNSADDSFCFVTLDRPATSGIFEAFTNKFAEAAKWEKACIEERDRYNRIVDALEEWRYGSIKDALEKIKDPNVTHLVVQIMIDCGLLSRSLSGDYHAVDDKDEEIDVRSIAYSGSPLLDSYVKQRTIEEKHKDNYGWLEPDGTFHPVPWCEHQEWATEALRERGWWHDFRHWDNIRDLPGDYLTQVKGWVLLHNPGRGVAYVSRSESKRLTKAQKEFLFDYFYKRGLRDKAMDYLED